MLIIWGKDQHLYTGATAAFTGFGPGAFPSHYSHLHTAPVRGGVVVWQARPGSTNIGPLVMDWGAVTRFQAPPAKASYVYFDNLTCWGYGPGASSGNRFTLEWGSLKARAGANAFLEAAVTLVCSATSSTPSTLQFGVNLSAIASGYLGSGASLEIGVDLSCEASSNPSTANLQFAVELLCLPEVTAIPSARETCLTGDGDLPPAPAAQTPANRWF